MSIRQRQHSQEDEKNQRHSSYTATLVIPTYNERANVTRIIERCQEALIRFDTEIIVIDDDSPDETWKLARETYADDESVRVVRRTEERGLATAVFRGFREAQGEYIAVIDADLQHPPEKLPELLSQFEPDVDIVIGSRHIEGGGIENWPWTRRAVSKGATWLSRFSVPSARGVSDPMSGFFAVRHDIVDGVELNPSGYKILLEILARCDYDGVVEVPYVFKERVRGESKLTGSEYINFVEHLLSLSIVSRGFDRFVDPKRGVRAVEFALIGAIGTVVNTLVFVAGYDFGLHYLLAGTLAFLVAVNANFIGNWALTFDQPEEGVAKKYAKFHVVSIAGFLIYSALLSVGLNVLTLPAVVANVGAVVLSAFANFLGADTFAFRAV